MKYSTMLIAITTGLLAVAIQAPAQTMYQVTFKGTIVTTNANGDIISQKLSNKNFLQDAQTAAHATNGTLVYVQNASTDPTATGDFIEVINSTNDTPVYTNLQFMYGGSSFPPALTNSGGTQIAIGAQVIPLPLAGSGSTLGGATINERVFPNGKTMINGTFNYTSLRSAGSDVNDASRFYSGSFNVGKPIPTP